MSFDDELQPSPDGMANLMGHLMPAGKAPAPGRKSRVTEAGGRVDGKFVLGPLRDSGRFGDVYEARQFSPTKRPKVALKILKQEMMSPEALVRFEREGQALTDLDHPGIPKYFHAGSTGDGRPYIAMEWVDGIPITIWCRKFAAGDWKIILEVFIQVCEAIFYAHSIGIVHRDVKPSNILVTRGKDVRPRVKVIDFGIAKLTVQDPILRPNETVIGTFIGTPPYMSPEQIECLPGEVEPRSDIYSLAAVLYELVTGRPPLDLPEGSSIQEWRSLVRTGKPCPASQMENAISFPRELDGILREGLAKSRTKRYATAEDFAADLRLLLKGETSAVKRRRDQAIVNRCAAVLMGLALAGGAVALAFVQGTPPAPETVQATPQAPVLAPAEREKEDLRNFALAITIVRDGKSESPVQRLREVQTAQDIARPYVERAEPSPLWLQNWVEAKRWEGCRLLEIGNPEASEIVLEEGLQTIKYFKARKAMTPALMEKEALIYHEKAAAYRAQGEGGGDINCRLKELRIYERLTDLEDPQRVAGQRYTCATLRYQLALLLEKKDPAQAAELIERAAQGHRAAYRSTNPIEQPVQVASRYCTTLEKRIELAAVSQNHSTHVDSLRELIDLSENCFMQSMGTDWGRLAAKTRAALARILETGGDADGAQAEYVAAVELGRRVQPHLNRADFSRDLEGWTRKLLP